LVLVHPRVEPVDVPQQIGNLAGGLHPRIAAADHHEGQQPAAHGRLEAQTRLFEPLDQVYPQPDGVADGFHKVAMLRHARHVAHVDHAAQVNTRCSNFRVAAGRKGPGEKRTV
jgi:hypothetical protein